MLPPTPSPHDGPRPEGHVDQIRDILFGGQMREYDHRFAQVEDRIVVEHEKLRQEAQEQAHGLQELLTAALQHLSAQVEADKSQHATATQNFAQEVHGALVKIGRDLKENTERGEQRHQELVGQWKAFAETERMERETLAIRLDQQFKQLAATAVDRATLADLLGELAARFRSQASGPA